MFLFKPFIHMNTNRRSLFKKISMRLAGMLGISAAKAGSIEQTQAQASVVFDQDVPLFSSNRVYNGLVFIAGKGAHFEGDIKAHTDHVLNELQKELEKAGSSMENVVKANVYLADLADYKAMNEVFKGRFGKLPP